MNKKAIQGLASGASGHNAAKPSGLGRRVDGTLARRKLMLLSGEASMACVPRERGASLAATPAMAVEESAKGVVAA